MNIFTCTVTLPVTVYRFRIILRCLQSSMTWTAKSTNLKENAGKIKVVFVIRAALWAEKLGGCLEYWWSWKNTLENLQLQSTLEAILFEFWMKGTYVSDGGNLCPPWLVILKLVWHGETPYQAAIQLAASCGELHFSRCCGLKRTGTFASERKVTCLF